MGAGARNQHLLAHFDAVIGRRRTGFAVVAVALRAVDAAVFVVLLLGDDDGGGN